jgi:DNA-binding beta-propeller fold protein YncE
MAYCTGHSVKETCIECEVPQRARNHYFTGKLLVERDFTDEQRYYMSKERRHNQRLHGWGTVCGLKVTQHPNPACRNQYVVIEPGTAIDCCGREILVTRQEYFDFRARLLAFWKQQHGEAAKLDDQPHTVQICVRYTECPTEEVPAIFDECGCDDTACQPNRILEGYEFDVVVDPDMTMDDPSGVRLHWHNTINVARARRVEVHDPTHHVYILKGDSPATLFAVSTVNHSILASRSFANSQGLDLAVSPDGKWLYVALQDSGGGDPHILVLDTADLAKAPFNTLAVTGGNGGQVRLAVAPDGRLYAVNAPLNQVLVWGADITTSTTPAAPTPVTVGTQPVDIVIGRNGQYAYVANQANHNISAIKTADLIPATIPVGTGGTATPAGLAVASTTVGDNLAVVDRQHQMLYLIGWRPDAAVPADRVVPIGDPVSGFAHRPMAVLTSPGGAWVYVLEQDDADNKAYIQPVNAHRVELKQPNILGPAEPVGEHPQDMALTADGRRIYAAYEGPGAADAGGVAIVDVIEEPCADLFKRALEACPTCASGNCVVLATIKDYVAEQPITDDRIDNLTDRHLLPSTDLITEVVQCLLEKGTGTGERGEQGPPGSPGADGTSVKTASAETGTPVSATFNASTGDIHFVIPPGAAGADGTSVKSASAETGTPVSATFNAGTGDIHFVIPKGEQGDPGGFLTLDLPRIVNINWPHNGQIKVGSAEHVQLNRDGLIIAFEQTKPVFAETLDGQSIQVLFRHRGNVEVQYEIFCYCNVQGIVTGAKVEADCEKISVIDHQDLQAGAVTGARFRPFRNQHPIDWLPGEYRVVVEGDFILGFQTIEIPDATDPNKKITVHPALDANHLGPGLLGPGSVAPAGLPKRCPTGNGTEGGRFVSWFSIAQ